MTFEPSCVLLSQHASDDVDGIEAAPGPGEWSFQKRKLEMSAKVRGRRWSKLHPVEVYVGSVGHGD